MTHNPTLGFIGAGKVGCTLARLWYAKGYQVRAVYSRTQIKANLLAFQVGAAVVESAGDVVRAADLTLLTVPDDAISSVVSAIGRVEIDSPKAFIHTSGARDVNILTPLAEMGFMTGSLHPAFPFADVKTAMSGLPGATFGIEANAEVLNQWLAELVAAIDGHILAIPDGHKALYHSAFVFTSNYVITLYAIAERLLMEMGAERTVADQALDGLLAGTVENLRRQGIPGALTGPLVRGDVETVATHLQVLREKDTGLFELYRQLAMLTLPMLTARNIDTSFIEPLLNRENHASDHS